MEALGILVIIVFIICFASIKVVRQAEVYIIERLGKYHNTAGAGINFIIPFVDRVRAVVSIKTQTLDIPPQNVITKDNVTITVDNVVFYRITDPARAVYGIESLKRGIMYLAITTIRDIVGKMDLDQTFSSRDVINVELCRVLDEATDKWGCKVERVEIKDINPPTDIKNAMEKQMNAERNKRALILEAEGQRQSAITVAEGEKQSKILEAEAQKESSIRIAEGQRQAKILEAQGEAEAILNIAKAKAAEIDAVYAAIMNSKPDEKLVALKSLEALKEAANGKANKVFIPFDATKTLGAVATLAEMSDKAGLLGK
ncbi:MAG: SPFH/Band 7/PHB domain protein [Abditibacteriota bacterium]|nr:SPFH/Band 7/PHB domain protein [Abditibacteriota bacterium]MBP5094018.1 SPFH/Band 7/PHB domain protein [Abditibacteriota bacterium]MBP5738302.1 SPFH/Band 7/PHB domain protein [Abditibacteriota bacterium]